MKNLTFLFVLILISILELNSQDIHVPTDTIVKTEHTVLIGGIELSYTVQTGMLPVWDKDGKAIASVHYTYYTKNGIKDNAKRPLLFSFNGGPGSGSVWMHMAYTGPYVLKVDDEGFPVQPYGVKENPYSVLDVTDIVYVNPVNTGYSRTIPLSGKEVNRDNFFGINADVKYLADWMNTFVSKNERWLSPKYIIGESYGGTRVAGLSLELQDRQWMYLNGVIMVSPADYSSYNNGSIVSSALNIPYMAATAWYHKVLPEKLQSKDLEEVLPEVEEFTVDVLMPALAMGGFLDSNTRERVAQQMSTYIGIDKDKIVRHNLDVPTSYFWKELLRDEKELTVGRLDSRYLGLDKRAEGSRPDYNSELKSWLHSFTPAINHYFSNHLNFKIDLKYNMFGPVHPWDRRDDKTQENLRQAMAQNPFLNVLYQTGYYDGATTYFNSKYSMWQLDPSGKMKDRLSFKGYRSGHMMYLRQEDLKQANHDLREFILKTSNNKDAAKY